MYWRSSQSGTLGLSPNKQAFWALRDISFDIQHGEVVGVIGRSRAGKRRAEDSSHHVAHERTCADSWSHRIMISSGIVRTRTSSSMAPSWDAQAEIAAKFDGIVAFAEVQFVDTPVKHYSSGMYVRLAFAIAAHLEPEILIVDEVLAVGDLAFQQKCLGKMSEVSQAGRTILFVSHNMAVVEKLCQRAILLQEGEIYFQGDTEEAIHRYMHKMLAANQAEGHTFDLSQSTDRRPSWQIAKAVELTLAFAGITDQV